MATATAAVKELMGPFSEYSLCFAAACQDVTARLQQRFDAERQTIDSYIANALANPDSFGPSLCEVLAHAVPIPQTGDKPLAAIMQEQFKGAFRASEARLQTQASKVSAETASAEPVRRARPRSATFTPPETLEQEVSVASSDRRAPSAVLTREAGSSLEVPPQVAAVGSAPLPSSATRAVCRPSFKDKKVPGQVPKSLARSSAGPTSQTFATASRTNAACAAAITIAREVVQSAAPRVRGKNIEEMRKKFERQQLAASAESLKQAPVTTAHQQRRPTVTVDTTDDAVHEGNSAAQNNDFKDENAVADKLPPGTPQKGEKKDSSSPSKLRRPPTPGTARTPDAWQALRMQIPLSPKCEEDNYEITDHEGRHDEDERTQERRRAMKSVPDWCKDYMKTLQAQVEIDADTIFGSRPPKIDQKEIFPSFLYEQLHCKKPQRKRGSSQDWRKDPLTRHECGGYRKKMGQVLAYSPDPERMLPTDPRRKASSRERRPGS